MRDYKMIHNIDGVVGVSYSRNSGKVYAMPSSMSLTIVEGETLIVYASRGNIHTMYTVDDGLVVSQDYRIGVPRKPSIK